MISTEEIRTETKQQLILRVADSSLFQKSPRLREFLLYAADCTLSNRLADVREQVIAEKVFQRKAEYYDVQDSIVRAEARNLRKRLERYFETEGSEEKILVSMPKGGYSIAFEPRPPQRELNTAGGLVLETAPSLSRADSHGAASEELAPHRVPRPSAVFHRSQQLVSLSLGVMAFVALALAIRWYPGSPSGLSATLSKADMLPFSALFDNKQETLIVTSDTAFLQISQLEGRRLTLNDYLVRAYPDIPHLSPPDLIQRLNRAQFTDGAEMTIAGLMMRRNAQFLQRTFLRSGRQVTLGDFKNHNIVLLGSPISNPWADLYANYLNFQFEFDTNGGITFHNRSPRAGELPKYPSPLDGQLNRTYAQLAFLPSTSPDNGNVLLLGGTTAEATAAAGEFLLNESDFARTMKKIGVDPKGPPRYCELLLRATTFVGGDTQSEVISYRLHPYAVD